MRPRPLPTAILLGHGPLRERVAARLTDFVYRNGGRIVSHDQYVDHQRQRYFTRLEWELGAFAIARGELGDRLLELASPLELRFDLYFSEDVPRVALFVSTLAHCLYDLLARWRSGEWRIEVPLVVSNHDELAEVARRFDVQFLCFPVTPENRREQEARELAILRERAVELVVLARYMQVLGPELLAAYPGRIINIHHAFLPAFPGGKPYHAAHRRGVKLIGATSHYVTEALDAGPIIHQDVVSVNHGASVEDMVRLGREIERTVLARAVWAHIERRVIVDEGRTVVFA